VSAGRGPRVLVLGARGMLGSDIVREAPAGVDVILPPGGRVDIREHAQVDHVIGETRADIVINCAAYTQVDRAETEVAEATAVNAVAVGALGESCAKHDVRVVHFSTDYVFAGDAGRPYTEADDTGPLGVYGRTKLEGEQLLRAAAPASLVIRTQWLFGRAGRSFPRTMWERARSGRATQVVADQRGCPTHAVALARATWELIEQETEGLMHAAGGDSASWHELAQVIFARAGVPELLSPCTTADYPTRTRRPVDSRLDCTRLQQSIGRPLPMWRHSLAEFLDELDGTPTGS